MAGFRRGVGAVLKYLTPLVLIAAVIQVFLAGGIFGLEEGQALEDATSLDPHRDTGFIVAHIGGPLLLLLALLWWPRNKRLLGLYVAAAVALIIQPFLTEGGEWVGGLHPLNALLIVGLLGYLSSRWWRQGGAAMTDERSEGAPTTR